MTRENIHAIMNAVSDVIPQEQVLYLRNLLEKADDRCYDSFITIKLKSPVTTILFSVFLGCLGGRSVLYRRYGTGRRKTFAQLADCRNLAAH